MASDRPIIVVGCPRSGTTMLQLMLHAHPRIAIPPENRFVLPAYERRHKFGDLTQPDRRRALGEWIAGYHRFSDLGLDPDAVVEQIVAAPPTVGSALGTVFKMYAARFGKPRWGDKRPAYLRSLDAILRLFPDAQIINIIRDGRDCVASLKEVPWQEQSIYQIVGSWSRAADEGQRATRRLDPTSYYPVRYEDLVSEPEKQLRALCAFLDEEYDPAMARPSAVATVAVPSYKTWHARTHSDVTTERVSSWQHRLTPDEIALCESAFGARLTANGYELSGAPAPRLVDRARYAWTSFPHRLAPAKRAVVLAAERLRPGPPVAARLTTRQTGSAVSQR
jgi:Sulfotransferase family